jgi:hypothetical protein
MLLLVSVFSESVTGRWIDVAAGAVLVALGGLLYRTKSREPVAAGPRATPPEPVESEPAPAAASTGGEA